MAHAASASSSTKNTALVVGALGVIGRHVTDYLSRRDDWDVIGLSRRLPDFESRARHVSIDLERPDEAAAALRACASEVTHVFFAAYQPGASFVEEVEPNLRLFRNLMDAIEPAAPKLQRVLLNEGVKAYGVHLGPFKTPARETDARHLPPNFYYSQDDLLKTRQAGKPWSYTVLRPDLVCGFSIGSAMNLPLIMATYAAISRELGVPLRFPGRPGAYTALVQATSSSLHAEASAWAATAPAAANEIFNVTNGDLFRWEHVWPRVAEFFDMPLAPPQTLPLRTWMADKAPVWDTIVRRHGLAPYRLDQLAAWPFGDFIWGAEYDVVSSTTKLRQAGFNRIDDSEEMFVRLLREFRAARIIP
jgi:nucleoside-diphosphate-sugar epimerase